MKFVIKYQLDIVFWYLIPGGILPWWSTDTCRTRFIGWSNIFYLTKWHNSNNQISFLDRKCSSNLNRSGKTRKKSHNELHQKSGSKSCLKLNNGRCQRTEQIYIYKYIKKIIYMNFYIYDFFVPFFQILSQTTIISSSTTSWSGLGFCVFSTLQILLIFLINFSTMNMSSLLLRLCKLIAFTTSTGK